MSKKNNDRNNNQGCGCANIPISVIILFLGGGFWWFKKNGLPDINTNQINSLLAKVPGIELQLPVSEPAPPPVVTPTPTPTLPPVSIPSSPELPTVPETAEATKNNQGISEPTQPSLSKTSTQNRLGEKTDSRNLFKPLSGY